MAVKKLTGHKIRNTQEFYEMLQNVFFMFHIQISKHFIKYGKRVLTLHTYVFI
jgi:hypothetical protein